MGRPWWRCGVVGLFAAALLGAVLFPLFARAKSGGKPNPPLWVAEAIQASRLVRHRWPEKDSEVRPFLRPVPHPFEFRIVHQGFEGRSALYEVSAAGRTGRWRIAPIDAPSPEYVR